MVEFKRVKSKKVVVECIICGTEFMAMPSNIKRGRAKLCSVKCRAAAARKDSSRTLEKTSEQ